MSRRLIVSQLKRSALTPLAWLVTALTAVILVLTLLERALVDLAFVLAALRAALAVVVRRVVVRTAAVLVLPLVVLRGVAITQEYNSLPMIAHAAELYRLLRLPKLPPIKLRSKLLV